MATFTVIAEVLTPDDPKVKAYHAGVLKGHPGMLLRDVLKRTDSEGYTTTFLPPRLRADIQKVAELSDDQALLEIAKEHELRVSVKHLMDLNPDTTWVAVGTRLMYTPEEADRLRRTGPEPDLRHRYYID